MSLLLTGGTGFLGKHLLTCLLEEYENIKILTRKIVNIDDTRVQIYQGDLSHPKSISKNLFEDIEILVHSAAKVGSWPKNIEDGYLQTNINGTRSIIDLAYQSGVEKILYTSSFFALGPTEGKIRDEKWNNPPPFEHPYIVSKYKAGQLIDNLVEYGYPIIQVNPTTIIGPGLDNVIGNLIVDYLNGNLHGLTNINSKMNFVDVIDVSTGHLLALRKGKLGEKYILGSKNMSYFSFFSLIGEIFELSPPRKIPYWMSILYAFFQELTGSPSITRLDLIVSKHSFEYSNQYAKSELGFNPSSLTESIINMSIDFEKRGLLKKDIAKKLTNFKT